MLGSMISSHGGSGYPGQNISVVSLSFIGLAMMFAGLPAVDGEAAPQRLHFAQMTIRRSIIVRVPLHPETVQHAPQTEWIEKGGERCISIDDLAGAEISSASSIDLVYRGGTRWRVKLREECPALGYYQGFYLRPGADRQLCVKRDVIHPRSGGECEISALKRLKAKRIKDR